MNWKARYAAAVLACAAVVSAAMIAAIVSFAGVPAGETGNAGVCRYVLRAENDRIAVYETGEREPFRVLDVPVSTLPPEEQAALEEGIPLKDGQALDRALEDFSG